MKTKITILTLFTVFLTTIATAQDRTTVRATNSEISDNLDLKAVASIFGDSQNLEDFEQRLNDPKIQISNLDLNFDNQVDYLRVIESVEGNTHLIIIQSVLERDVYQDVATIEIEKGNNNQVQVQVVGNVYMYGQNYIYEPVYVNPPVIYNSFWVTNYRPYTSIWYWNYYPTYYYAWAPYPVYRYRRNVHIHINVHNHYNYVNIRRSQTAAAIYTGRRSNGYERQYPNRSFETRNTNVANRYELDNSRNVSVRNQTRNGATNPSRATVSTRTPIKMDNSTRVRTNTTQAPKVQSTRINTTPIREQQSATRSSTISTRANQETLTNSATRNAANTRSNQNNTPRVQVSENTSRSSERIQSTPSRQSRQSSPVEVDNRASRNQAGSR